MQIYFVCKIKMRDLWQHVEQQQELGEEAEAHCEAISDWGRKGFVLENVEYDSTLDTTPGTGPLSTPRE